MLIMGDTVNALTRYRVSLLPSASTCISSEDHPCATGTALPFESESWKCLCSILARGGEGVQTARSQQWAGVGSRKAQHLCLEWE